MPIRIEKSTRIHDILYILRKYMDGMDGGDEDVVLFIRWINLIHYIYKNIFKKKYLMNVIEKK